MGRAPGTLPATYQTSTTQ